MNGPTTPDEGWGGRDNHASTNDGQANLTNFRLDFMLYAEERYSNPFLTEFCYQRPRLAILLMRPPGMPLCWFSMGWRSR